MAVLFIIVIPCIFSLSRPHYIPPVDPCILAKACNHTQIAQCGQETKDMRIRWFLDECDMREYNCDHKKEYMQTEIKYCPTHTSQHPDPVFVLTLTEGSTHGTMAAQILNATTTLIRPTEFSGTTIVSTLTTSNETTPISAKIASNETTIAYGTTIAYETTKYDTINRAAELSSSTNAGSELTSMSTYTNLSGKTILITSTDAPNGINLISTTYNGTTTFSTNRKPIAITNSSKMFKLNKSTTIITNTASNETAILVTNSLDHEVTETTESKTTASNRTKIKTYPHATTLLSDISTAISFVSTLPTSNMSLALTSNTKSTVQTSTTYTPKSIPSKVATAVIDRTYITLNLPNCTRSTTKSAITELVKNIGSTTVNVSTEIVDVNRNTVPDDDTITEKIIVVNTTTVISLGESKHSAGTVSQRHIPSTSDTKRVTVTNMYPSSDISEMLSTDAPTRYTDINTAALPSPVNCGSYPKECNIPITWETTAEGETRDFFQILRERFGNQAQLLRGTTHSPNRRLHKFLDKRHSFLFGRHSESNN